MTTASALEARDVIDDTDGESPSSPGEVVLSEEQRRLAESHMELVGHVVFQVAVNFPRHVDRGELACAGALGLTEAASRFDSSRGVPFERFAARRIRGAILDHVRIVDWAPRSVRHLAREIESTEQALTSRLGRAPSEDELAEELCISTERLQEHREKIYKSVVLALEYDVNDGDEDLTLVEVLADIDELDPLDQIEEYELKMVLQDAIDTLPERHRKIIIDYFLDGRKSVDIADDLGVTESRISQLRSEAVDMLRYAIGAQYDELRQVWDKRRSPLKERRLGDYAHRAAEASDWRDRV